MEAEDAECLWPVVLLRGSWEVFKRKPAVAMNSTELQPYMVKKKKSIKHGWTTESSCKEAEGSCLSQKVTAHQQKHCEQVCAGHVGCSTDRTRFLWAVLSDVCHQLWIQNVLFFWTILFSCMSVMGRLSICWSSVSRCNFLWPFETGDFEYFLLDVRSFLLLPVSQLKTSLHLDPAAWITQTL